MRLSCESFDSQTAQWHPSVGTPIEVPEPRTVSSRDGISAGTKFKNAGRRPAVRKTSRYHFVWIPARKGMQIETGSNVQDYFCCAAFFAIASAATLDISINVSLSWPRTSIRRSSSALERFPRVFSRRASSMSITSRAPSRSR